MLEATAVVLAGGKSSRMGQDKAFMILKENTMLENAVKLLSQEFKEVIISANRQLPDFSVRVIPDVFPDCGPLGGMHAALAISAHTRNFFVACDMPFIDINLARYLVELARDYQAVVPKSGKHYQPLFAVYTTDCLQPIEAQLKNRNNKITGFYDKVSVRFVESDELKDFSDPEKMFFNMNTPQDFEKAKELVRRSFDGTEV